MMINQVIAIQMMKKKNVKLYNIIKCFKFVNSLLKKFILINDKFNNIKFKVNNNKCRKPKNNYFLMVLTL